MKKIVVIGGGIGGAATALALSRVGFEPTVYERSQKLKEVGAGIALWANATHILKKLGLLDEARRVGNLITNYQFNSQHGKELVNIPVDGFELPVIGIHRAELHQLLWRNLPSEKFILGETFDRCDRSGDRIYAHFVSGLKVEGDALIGADGLRSRVRTAILGDEPPIYRNFKTWRGLTDCVPIRLKQQQSFRFLGDRFFKNEKQRFSKIILITNSGIAKFIISSSVKYTVNLLTCKYTINYYYPKIYGCN
jgi:2-polyprenyl-6-methoxyphenol hydroxylase-like FAD-dependent oxidoreductase